MKNTKKLVAVVMMLLLALGMLAGCGEKTPETVSEIVKVGSLNGPTGMGMVQMMDMTDKYEITTYQAPTDVVAKITNGEIDVAAVPSNLAAVLYNKTEGQIVAISPITLGVLHILGNNVDVEDVEDLKGMTIVASGQGGTPEYVLQKVLADAGLTIYEDVNVEWLSNHAEVNTKLLTTEGCVAMIPEPFVSTALAAKKDGVENIFDVNDLWDEATGEELPMGVLIATKSFVEERENDLKVLLKDLEASVEYVNENPAEAAKDIVTKGFIGKEEIAKAAIPNCNIVVFTGDDAEEGRKMLKTFNETLFEMNKASIGGKLPNEDLYY